GRVLAEQGITEARYYRGKVSPGQALLRQGFGRARYYRGKVLPRQGITRTGITEAGFWQSKVLPRQGITEAGYHQSRALPRQGITGASESGSRAPGAWEATAGMEPPPAWESPARRNGEFREGATDSRGKGKKAGRNWVRPASSGGGTAQIVGHPRNPRKPFPPAPRVEPLRLARAPKPSVFRVARCSGVSSRENFAIDSLRIPVSLLMSTPRSALRWATLPCSPALTAAAVATRFCFSCSRTGFEASRDWLKIALARSFWAAVRLSFANICPRCPKPFRFPLCSWPCAWF